VRLGAQPLPPRAAAARWCAEGTAARGAGSLSEFQYADLALRVPGFAGYAAGGDTLVLRLVDPAWRAAAEAAVRCFGRDTEAAAARHVVVEPARYTLAQLREWRWRLRVGAGAAPRPTYLATDEARNRLVVGFGDSTDFRAGRALLGRLGIPARAADLVVSRSDW
jgi:hypothetical protein